MSSALVDRRAPSTARVREREGGGEDGRAPLFALLAAGVYLALVVFVMAPIRSSPSSDVLFPVRAIRTEIAALIDGDQRFVAGTIARNARALLADPAALLGDGSCFPVAHGFTLGEHLFGESLLAAAPWAIFRDPVLATNAVVALSHWLAALSMYALVFGLTRASGAAFVAGAVFAFHPARIGNPVHPMVYGNLWTPLALLFAQRLFTRRRWRDAALLALALALELLESFYQILGLTILGGTYGIALAIRFRRDLVALVPKLALVLAVSAAVVAAVLLPYLDTRSAWDVLQDRRLVLMFSPGDYLPGHPAGFGWVPSALALLGVLDRFRGPRGAPGDDARLPLLVGGLLIFWCSVYAIAVPGIGRIESPFRLLAGVVPGLDAIRVPRAVCFNVYLVVAVLAGYGALALASGAARLGLSRGVRMLVPAALAALVLVEIFTPPLAEAGYAWPLRFVARPLAAPRPLVELYARTPGGAVLDLPFRLDPRSRVRAMPRYVFLSGYHGRPVAGCASSFDTPLQAEVEQLAGRLPDPAASDELYGLGFRTLVLHADLLDGDAEKLAAGLLADRERATRVGDAAGTTMLALSSPNAVVDDLAAIAPGDGAAAAIEAPARDGIVAAPPAGERGALEFPFRNASGSIYRQAAPIEPSRLVVRWRDGTKRVVREDEARALLPIALAPGARASRALAVLSPSEPGDYLVELALVAQPERVLSRVAVRVPTGEPAARDDRPAPGPTPAPADADAARGPALSGGP